MVAATPDGLVGDRYVQALPTAALLAFAPYLLEQESPGLGFSVEGRVIVATVLAFRGWFATLAATVNQNLHLRQSEDSWAGIPVC